MAKRVINSVKLGAFVLGGLLFLVLLLYMIGKNKNLFGSTYVLKARFENVQGLVSGNNVRFAGIEAGTVKRIEILSDTVVEVTMIIDTKMKKIIRKNAIVSIRTEGVVGNKVVNIIPVRGPADFAEDGDLLADKKSPDTDDIIETLHKTNQDISVITKDLKQTVKRINESTALWGLLNDQSIPANLRSSLSNLKYTTSRAGHMIDNLNAIVIDIRNGKGSAGALLTDSSFAINLNEAIVKIRDVGEEVESLANEISKTVTDLKQDIDSGKGTAHTLFKDSLAAARLTESLENLRKGTDGFNQNMEALKHNILFRGYFKRLEKEKRKANE